MTTEQATLPQMDLQALMLTIINMLSGVANDAGGTAVQVIQTTTQEGNPQKIAILILGGQAADEIYNHIQLRQSQSTEAEDIFTHLDPSTESIQ